MATASVTPQGSGYSDLPEGAVLVQSPGAGPASSSSAPAYSDLPEGAAVIHDPWSDTLTNLGQAAIGYAKSAARTLYSGGAAQGPSYLGGSGYAKINQAPAPDVVQPTNTAQKIGGYAETATELGAPFAVAAAEAPTFEKGAQIFEDLKGAIGQHTVDVAAPGNAALEIADFANQGGSMPKVVRDFIKRTTNPDLGPLNYDEARNFYSNATQKLSAEEAQRLSPNGKRLLGNFTDALGGAIQQTADQAGKLQDYLDAMSQYTGAGQVEAAKEFAKKTAMDYVQKWLIPGTVTAWAAKKYWDSNK